MTRPVATPGSREDAQRASPPNVTGKNWVVHPKATVEHVNGWQVHKVQEERVLEEGSEVVGDDQDE